MRARLRRSTVAAAAAGGAVFAAVVVLAGCGTGGPVHGGDAGNGKQLFATKCGSCHTLADAGTKGVIGPNLDEALRPDREQGFESSGIQQMVLDQIRLAQFGMPANIVTGRDAADVAAYVAQCAGTKCNVQAAGPPAGSASGPGGKGQGLFSSLGCQSCHTLDGSKSVGPTLKGIFGSTVEVAGGKRVKADEAYLVESIRDPDKQIAAGYAKGVMSAAIKPGSVSAADAQAIVDFLKQQK